MAIITKQKHKNTINALAVTSTYVHRA